MAAVQRYGLKNNLVRWVRRHDRVATLFRSTRPDPTGGTSARSIPVPMAMLTDEAPMRAALPKVAPSMTPSVGPGPIEYVQRAVQPSAPTVHVKSPGELPSVSAQAESAAAENKDRDWPRLQTILRKHQAKAQEEAAAITEISPSLEQRPADLARLDAHQTIEPESNQPIRPQPKANVEAVDLPSSPQPVRQEGSSNQNSRAWPNDSGQPIQTIQRRIDEPAKANFPPQEDSSQSVPPVPVQQDTSSRGKRSNLIQRAWHGVASIFRRSQDPVESRPSLNSTETEAVNFPPVDEDPITLPAISESSPPAMSTPGFVHRAPARGMMSSPGYADEPVESIAAAPGPEQTLPFEFGWRVQHLKTPSTESSMPIEIPEPASDTEIDTTPVPFDAEAPAPASESDTMRTSIEILPPSRPRPAHAGILPSRPTVQRQAEPSEPSFVETAIGPLPSDLWSLLGKKPPASSDAPRTAQQPRRNTDSTDRNVISPQQTGQPLPIADRTESEPASVQRDVISDAPAKPAGQELGTDKEASAAEPDLNDLAQKVYAEVRRRLARESERTHRYS